MKIMCSKSEILKGVQIVQSAVATKSTLPILSNLLIETEKGKISLTATDLEVGIKCFVSAEAVTPGAITIPAKRLGDIIRELPEAEIEIETENNKVVIKCEQATFKIIGLPKEDFPKLPEFSEERFFIMNQRDLKEMIRKTIFAVSQDETRYVLNGTYFVRTNEEIIMVSTDGHRLALVKERVENIPAIGGVIIPTKAINELSHLLTDQGQVKIINMGNQIIFKINDITLISRLIEGQFPNYEQVIPQSFEKRIRATTALLLSAIRRVSLLADIKSNAIRLQAKGNRLVITANTPEVGEAREEMEIGYEGEELQIAFNAKYIMDVLKNIDSEEVLMEFTGSLSPGLIKPLEGEDYLCVIMPMRI